MKPISKLTATLLVLASLSACKSYIDLPVDSSQKHPTVNYIAYETPSGLDEEAPLLLSRTDLVRPTALEIQSLSIAVNGTPAGITLQGRNNHSSSEGNVYAVKAAYKPGDEVTLSLLTSSGERLTAHQTVPSRPVIYSARAGASVAHKKGRYITLAVTVADKAGEDNYYRLSLELLGCYTVPGRSEEYYERAYRTRVDYRHDFILTEGNPSELFGEDMDLADLFGKGGVNRYLVFSDMLFADRHGKVEVRLSDNQFFVPEREIQLGDGTIALARLSHKVVRVRVEGLTAEAYQYYRALGALHAEDHDEENPFTTPVQVSSNVQGGAGIFTVASWATDTVRVPAP